MTEIDDEERLDFERSDITSPRVAARFLGVELSELRELSEEEALDKIKKEWRQLQWLVHPDSGGNAQAGAALNAARDELNDWVEGGMPSLGTFSPSEDSEQENWWGEQAAKRQEQYKETKEAIKLGFLEEMTGKNLEQFFTLQEAVQAGAVSQKHIHQAEIALENRFGENADLDTISDILAMLVVTGAMRMGNINFSAEEAGRFSRHGSGRFSGGGGRFSNRSGGSSRFK